MEKLAANYRPLGAEFFVVYTREAHPNNEIPQTQAYEERLANAKRLKSDLKVTFPVLVDDMRDRVFRAYGYAPNPVVVIDPKGRIAFAKVWCRADEIEAFFEGLLSGEIEYSE